MKQILALLLIMSISVFSTNIAFAQKGKKNATKTEQADAAAKAQADAAEKAKKLEEARKAAAEAKKKKAAEEAAANEEFGHQMLKRRFIEGGWGFMSVVLLCLILGLAFAIERIITLNIATTNTDKLLNRIDSSLKEGDIQGAMETCRGTQGPTASILHEGLKRVAEGGSIEQVEKSVVSYGSVQMGLLEKGLVWIALFIAIAPMLGFMGTVIGMIEAFDKIAVANDISPSVVAGGIKVALLTTVFGLIVAIILQIAYNFIVSKIDGIVNRMEDASIRLIDLLLENNMVK